MDVVVSRFRAKRRDDVSPFELVQAVPRLLSVQTGHVIDLMNLSLPG